MPEWLIDLLNNPVALTAIGTAFVTPILGFLANFFMRRTSPPGPVAYDARDLPEHPLLISAKVHLADEDMDVVRDIGREVERISDQVQLVQDRLDLLMRRPT
ncbi:hypothetical protein [Mangrovibrevibacter kandeliae]|uniref:hypothetical protein n=1 Tax=Mangrovibrevibacter kandeliae TaxID=2968473 RepID=UPI002119B5A1|nr:hypothetical protein [Aurantimonas sp. CSK15Z-1]MCQ8781741.1 hypothetical protein [Aurantimonas sp. CSK15Z-1]